MENGTQEKSTSAKEVKLRKKEMNCEQMESRKLIYYIENIVEQACKSETNAFGYGIWSHHIVVVTRYGKLLAEQLKADSEIVEIAALLHDYAGIKDIMLHNEHHIFSAIEAEKILVKLDYPKQRIELIKSCIQSHRGSIEIQKESIEAICLASADAMAHIDQIPSLLRYVYYNEQMGIDEGAKWVLDKIDRSWKKLCPEAKNIIGKKYECAKTILGV